MILIFDYLESTMPLVNAGMCLIFVIESFVSSYYMNLGCLCPVLWFLIKSQTDRHLIGPSRFETKISDGAKNGAHEKSKKYKFFLLQLIV